MVKNTKGPTLTKPGPKVGDVAGPGVPDIETMSLINKMLKVLVLLKEDEMERNYALLAARAGPTGGPAAGSDHHDNNLMNQLDYAVLRAGGGRQTMEEKATLRNSTKTCIGPDGITFDMVKPPKDAHMHGGLTWLELARYGQRL